MQTTLRRGLAARDERREAAVAAAARGFARRVLDLLPRGRPLPEAAWSTRHRAIVVLLWCHVPALTGFALAMGFDLAHALVEGAAVAAPAVFATWQRPSRTLRATAASFGLMTASAVLVHVSGGYIEAHFHFFVVVGVMALYQSWIAFLVAVGYVVAHHGIVGILDPRSVFNHEAAFRDPVAWAVIHGAFIAAMSVATLTAWRLAERQQLAAQRRLEALSAGLERSNRELHEFASVAAHDLQEPLRKIQAFGDRLGGYTDELDETGRDYLERMTAAARRMQQLTQDLLTYSRVATDSGGRRHVALEPLVHEVLTDLEERIEARRADVRVESLPVIEAEPLQMRQLFQNLIANALKFVPPGTVPQVRIWAEPVPVHGIGAGERPMWKIFVADNGIGFEEHQRERIFAPFQRLHAPSAYEGTGMGLAICRRVVERHGGEITATSHPGEGATFIVTLPSRQRAPAAELED